MQYQTRPMAALMNPETTFPHPPFHPTHLTILTIDFALCLGTLAFWCVQYRFLPCDISSFVYKLFKDRNSALSVLCNSPELRSVLGSLCSWERLDRTLSEVYRTMLLLHLLRMVKDPKRILTVMSVWKQKQILIDHLHVPSTWRQTQTPRVRPRINDGVSSGVIKPGSKAMQCDRGGRGV